jgi:hypothetical protein
MMLLPRAVKVYFATQPTNLRQSFEGLSNQIRHALVTVRATCTDSLAATRSRA